MNILNILLEVQREQPKMLYSTMHSFNVILYLLFLSIFFLNLSETKFSG